MQMEARTGIRTSDHYFVGRFEAWRRVEECVFELGGYVLDFVKYVSENPKHQSSACTWNGAAGKFRRDDVSGSTVNKLGVDGEIAARIDGGGETVTRDVLHVAG